ncbi:uncharacterized protein LOC133285392 [Gastrolobium bilobum]|uniref:uncharacterized protein LOC133285392 n=1 Tax=Gastrolobium bilobum TaxID=150636 RepID=UPI002AB20A19|nr:uncharacterized protein LOC133285392 [Gastrolobium bilobum]
MLLRETIRKTKALFHKSLRNFKSFILGRYQKLPRSLSFNPFLGRNANARTYTSDQFYNEFYEILQSDLNRIKSNDDIGMIRTREQVMGDAASNGSLMSFDKQIQPKSIPEDGAKEKKNKGHSQIGKKEEDMNESAHVLAQKMKELEMMDTGDVEHVLDVEEALHYYSRLTSPVYLDIVDKFFSDMHSEYYLPQSSVSIKRSKSKGRLGPIRL